ncbi:S66 peptidase family protein [Myroides sp. LJL115]
MTQPDYLKKGDKVAIVCTARKFSSQEAQQALKLLESWGLIGVLGETIDVDCNQLGGTDKQRIKDFNAQLADPSIKAIWCARGGYGTVRIIDHIDFSLLEQNPKWVIGFSDVSVLHCHINQFKIPTIHGIMAFSVANSTQESLDSLYAALFGKAMEYSIESSKQNIQGEATAELVGGNLSILYSLLGSVSSLDTKGKILFIEDLDEYLYHVDRMMYNLDRNGLLKDLKGLIVGGMTKMHDNQIPFGQDAKQIVLSFAKKHQFPVVFDFPAGHDKENYALIFGQKVKLVVTKQESTLTFLEV